MSKENNLINLYPSPESLEFKQDLSKANEMVESLNAKYKNRIKTISGDEFGVSVEEYEKTKGLLDKMTNYLFALYSKNSDNEEIKTAYINYSQEAIPLNDKIAFFEEEIKNLDHETLSKKMESEKVIQYRKWLMEIHSSSKLPFDDNDDDYSYGVLPNSLKLAGLSIEDNN